MMKNKIYINIILAISLAMACTLTSCIKEDSPDEIESMKPGDKIPDFSVLMNDGSTVSLSDLEGKISVIVFFRTTCPDCQHELPVLQQVYDEFGSKIRLLLITTGEGSDSVERYWSDNNLNLPYSAQPDKVLAERFKVSRVPQVYISDGRGVIRYTHSDNPIATYEKLVGELNVLLSE